MYTINLPYLKKSRCPVTRKQVTVMEKHMWGRIPRVAAVKQFHSANTQLLLHNRKWMMEDISCFARSAIHSHSFSFPWKGREDESHSVCVIPMWLTPYPGVWRGQVTLAWPVRIIFLPKHRDWLRFGYRSQIDPVTFCFITFIGTTDKDSFSFLWVYLTDSMKVIFDTTTHNTNSLSEDKASTEESEPREE